MRNRLATALIATAAAAALAGPVGAQASQGADDPAGHVRQESRQTTAASTSTSARKRTSTKHRHRHGRRHVRRADDNSAQRRAQGTDDSTTARRARGTDDGPNHS
ncbi:MAG: hypothetical protein QOD44_1714 [Solirubrobacteraceae bacterium]|jgi:hypothetical protein|nr:hypothetical protein [Solirubrobacteraceae bacterium]MEA2317525.1 hypothetical protein [Solirubrobacteraceae bacterium]